MLTFQVARKFTELVNRIIRLVKVLLINCGPKKIQIDQEKVTFFEQKLFIKVASWITYAFLWLWLLTFSKILLTLSLYMSLRS